MDPQSGRLIIIRHGNTFGPGEVPRRIGARTDLTLTDEGRAQIARLADHFYDESVTVDYILSSPLARTMDSARIIADQLGIGSVESADWLREIDYGPDENAPEVAVINRLGPDALTAWEREGITPPGWSPDAQTIMQRWIDCAANRTGTTALVTSNGIARFAGVLTGDFGSFAAQHGLKMHTGAYGVLERDTPSQPWRVVLWNRRP